MKLNPPDLSKEKLFNIFKIRHKNLDNAGWGVKMNQRFEYFNPDVYYETVVEQLVHPATSWLDVGGGSDLFPSDEPLAAALTARCARLVAVDPSENVLHNAFAHQKVQALLEDYKTEETFDLATMRMVVEHVADPQSFVSRLGQLVRPGGVAVIYTVNKYAPITVISKLTPFGVHVAVKRVLWKADEEDTFPTVYKMNTEADLKRYMTAAGFDQVAFYRLDDCRALARWKPTLWLELTTRRVLRGVGLGYPEQCLLGIYCKVR